MKTKKLVSLFLAVAMIFAVLTVVVSADLRNSNITGSVNNAAYGNCTFYGTFLFVDSTRKAMATTYATNNLGTTTYFRVQAQCVVHYSDDTYDHDSQLYKGNVLSGGTASQFAMVNASFSKTITSFSTEYHVGDSNLNSIWEAYYGPSYVLGVNA